MGGKAFTHPPHNLHVPRLPDRLYRHLTSESHILLSTLYDNVATPIPAPNKKSHGDIDILVSSPRTPGSPPSTAQLKELLGATNVIAQQGSSTTAFAVPISQATISHSQTDPALLLDPSGAPPPPFVQLDINHTPPALFAWSLFHHSHGDLWNLLGTTIRPFGLTANEKGFHLRIGEIEALDRKKALVHLTTDPRETLRFLGYREEREGDEVLRREFESTEELYAFVGRGRFFRREFYEDWSRSGKSKSSDRKRLGQRECFRDFVEVWVPSLPAGLGVGDPDLTRERVAEEALERFGKRGEFEGRLEAWREERRRVEDRQVGRAQRKEEAEELDVQVAGWVSWLAGNAARS